MIDPLKFNELILLCKGSISIFVNDHKDNYQSIEEFIEEHKDSIYPEDISEMVRLDTVFNVHAYPDTPIGFYHHYSHDVNKSLDAVIEAIKEQRKC